jgi:hypothetical protein
MVSVAHPQKVYALELGSLVDWTSLKKVGMLMLKQKLAPDRRQESQMVWKASLRM